MKSIKLDLLNYHKPLPLLCFEPEVYDYEDFWNWFTEHSENFLQILRVDKSLDSRFAILFRKALNQICKELDFSIGLYGENGFRIALTSRFQIKNIVFAEELVAAAPDLANWEFIALMQQLPNNEFMTQSEGVIFTSNEVFFFATENANLPDLINVTLVHKRTEPTIQDKFEQGCYQFLLHSVGELETLTMIDSLTIRLYSKNDPELIPISKLSAYLRWRESEFVEKYKNVRYDHDHNKDEKHVSLEGEALDDGLPIKAMVPDRYLLCWNETASHPWLLFVRINFDGSQNNGLPDKDTEEKIKTFEVELSVALEMKHKGYLELISYSTNGIHNIVVASNEFRQISKIAEANIVGDGEGLAITYSIIKDKYWTSLDMFKQICLKGGGIVRS